MNWADAEGLVSIDSKLKVHQKEKKEKCHTHWTRMEVRFVGRIEVKCRPYCINKWEKAIDLSVNFSSQKECHFSHIMLQRIYHERLPWNHILT